MMDNLPPRTKTDKDVDAELLAAFRARRIAVLKSLNEEPKFSPWKVTAAAVVSGIVLAALIITAAYLTPPLGR